MKMNYPLRNNSKPRNKNRRLKIIAVIFIFATVFFISLTGASRGFLNKIALPFWKFDNYAALKFSNAFSIIGSKKSLILENKRLSLELNKIKTGLSLQEIIQ